MNDISKLAGINAEEITKLRNKKIATIDDLWNCIGADINRGIVRIARLTGIPRDRLIELLAAQGASEARAGGEPWLQRHWLDSILIFGALFLFVLLLRAFGALADLPPPIGLRAGVIVATRDMKAGQILRADDLAGAPITPRDAYFTDAQALEGLILAQDIPRNRPLRFEDALRLQVTAATDIPSDTLMESAAITLTWSAYQPGAALRIEQVTGRKARHAFRKGEVILSEFIETEPTPTAQTNTTSSSKSPPFHTTFPIVMLLREPKRRGLLR